MQLVPEEVIQKYLNKVPQLGDEFTIRTGTYKVIGFTGDGVRVERVEDYL